MSQQVGNGANRIVWAVAAVLALGYLSLQAWTASKVVEMSERLTVIETRLEIAQRQP